MKKTIILAIATALISPVIAQSAAQQAAAFNKQGQEAEKAGDPAAAQAAYASALKVDPNNANARYSLGQLKINSAGIAAKGRESKFGKVMIPSYQIEDATLQEALTLLAVQMEKESKKEVIPNFVIDDPKQVLANRKLALNLKNMPSGAILKYLTDQSGTKVRYDEHAIVVMAR